jgi:hypothetical protein
LGGSRAVPSILGSSVKNKLYTRWQMNPIKSKGGEK